jgi:hypothetical protein
LDVLETDRLEVLKEVKIHCVGGVADGADDIPILRELGLVVIQNRRAVSWIRANPDLLDWNRKYSVWNRVQATEGLFVVVFGVTTSGVKAAYDLPVPITE